MRLALQAARRTNFSIRRVVIDRFHGEELDHKKFLSKIKYGPITAIEPHKDEVNIQFVFPQSARYLVRDIQNMAFTYRNLPLRARSLRTPLLHCTTAAGLCLHGTTRNITVTRREDQAGTFDAEQIMQALRNMPPFRPARIQDITLTNDGRTAHICMYDLTAGVLLHRLLRESPDWSMHDIHYGSDPCGGFEVTDFGQYLLSGPMNRPLTVLGVERKDLRRWSLVPNILSLVYQEENKSAVITFCSGRHAHAFAAEKSRCISPNMICSWNDEPVIVPPHVQLAATIGAMRSVRLDGSDCVLREDHIRKDFGTCGNVEDVITRPGSTTVIFSDIYSASRAIERNRNTPFVAYRDLGYVMNFGRAEGLKPELKPTTTHFVRPQTMAHYAPILMKPVR